MAGLATALMLLMPATPMLFQGQEFGATSPFLYFADHKPELAEAVRKGRAEFMGQFPSLKSPEMQGRLPLPHDPASFVRCKLDWTERETNRAAVDLHRDLLALRRTDAAFRAQDSTAIEGAVLGVMEFFSREIREPDASLLEMLGTIGALIGQFMERRRAEEELVQPPHRVVALRPMRPKRAQPLARLLVGAALK